MTQAIRSKENQEEQQRSEKLPDAALPLYDDGARRKQSALYEQIAARGPFRYDAAEDPLYALARDRAVQTGRLAMKDSLGQAAALTGGYDSSYAQAQGRQQYDASLQSLSELLPELYEAAYARFRDQSEALERRAEQLGLEDRQAYERARDALADERAEREWQQRQADRDYDRSRDALADERAERDWQERQADRDQSRQDAAYVRLSALISATGYAPGEAELAAAGMSQGVAEALRGEYLRKTGQLPESGGSGGGRGRSKSEQKLGIDDVLRQAEALRHSNQHRELYRSLSRAVEEGKTDFSRAELDALWRRHHWQD